MAVPKNVAYFFARLVSNTNKDLFLVRLGVQLLLRRFGIVGYFADVVGYFLRSVVGILIEESTFFIDISLDAYKEGQKLKEFEEEATKAYKKATAKVYTEAEKKEIRDEYLKIISGIGNVGNPK